MKNILQRDNQKRCSTSTYLTALSNRTVKKESGVGDARGKKEYQNNGTENLFVVII